MLQSRRRLPDRRGKAARDGVGQRWALSFIRRTGEPLLVLPQQAAQTICWYDSELGRGWLLAVTR